MYFRKGCLKLVFCFQAAFLLSRQSSINRESAPLFFHAENGVPVFRPSIDAGVVARRHRRLVANRGVSRRPRRQTGIGAFCLGR